MTYNWQKHVKPRYSQGAGGAGRAIIGTSAPKGLHFSSGFYLRWAYDCLLNAIHFSEDEDEQSSISELLQLLRELDKEFPYLRTATSRHTEGVDTDGI